MSQSQNFEDNSLFRIMIATDNHLGYLENDQMRGDDSFTAFEEILKVSKTENVDFLLLGGDLFHHHNPSKKTIIRASNILQKHVYGQKVHKFEVFCYEPNFKNENLSIELPIFIIHGNHDDPSGFENFSSIDIFSNKEVNYFGKVNNYEEFDLYPILFVKGSTKIALYGIGNIKDERIYLALQNKKVNFHRPDDFKSWFNILIVHQNRFKGHHTGKNKKNYLPESFIPSFFDLVIWGHEHECFTEPVYNNEVGFHVYQPGSSVVTSLIQAESKPKCMGMLELYLDRFRVVPIRLETVRPFVFQQIELKQFGYRLQLQDDVEKLIVEKIEEMLTEAKHWGLKMDANNEPSEITDQLVLNIRSLPILRLKIEFSGYQITRTNFIVSKYSGRIANPNEVIQFYKKGDLFTIKQPAGSKNEMMDMDHKGDGLNLDEEVQDNDDELRKFVNKNISTYFVEKNKKSLFNSEYFCDALEKCVNGQEKRSVELVFKTFYENCMHNVKLNDKENILKDLQPLENAKKDFTNVMEELISKDEINLMMLNNIKYKRVKNNDGFGHQNELTLNNAVNNMIKQTSANASNSVYNSYMNKNSSDTRGNNGIMLTKVNDFQNEKRFDKDDMIIDAENKMDKFSIHSNSNSNNNLNNINVNMGNKQQKYSRSILDFIGKKSSVSGSCSSPKSNLSHDEESENLKNLLDDKKLPKIKEIDEDDNSSIQLMMEKPDAQGKNKAFIGGDTNRKKKGFLIQEKNIGKKKK